MIRAFSIVAMLVLVLVGCSEPQTESTSPTVPEMLPTDRPMPGEIEEAKQHPDGWVYRIEGDYGPDDGVPPEAIVGAWKVDANGVIVGDFTPNPNFIPAADR